MSERINRRDLLVNSIKFAGGLAGELTIGNILNKAAFLGLSAETVSLIWNAHRTIDSIQNALQPDPPYDAVVVLGAGNADENGQQFPSPDGEMRVIAGVGEYHKGSTKIIRLAGGAMSGEPEADAMERFIASVFIEEEGIFKKVPPGIIQKERESIDTRSNIDEIEVWKKANPDVEKIAVVTSGVHVVAAQALAKNRGIDLYPVVAEKALWDTGEESLRRRVRKYFSDGFKAKKAKEQERDVMLLFDPDSNASHSRFNSQNDPIMKEVYSALYQVLKIATDKLFSTEMELPSI